MTDLLVSVGGLLLGHWDWILGALGIATGGAGFVFPKAAKWIVLAGVAAAIGILVSVLLIKNANLRADAIDARAEAFVATTQRDQEKAAAAKAKEAFIAAEAQRLSEAATRIEVQKKAAADRKTAERTIKEMERANDNRPIGPTLRPLLRPRRVQ